MNMDDFLDNAGDNRYTTESTRTKSDVKNSLKLHESSGLPTQSSMKTKDGLQSSHTDEIDFLNDSISEGWDEQVANLVAQINQSVAEDEYDIAIQKYMELKELPSRIIEADLKTQANLKNELQIAHQKLTVHMKEIEAKHSAQTSQLKKLISLALTELESGKEEIASNLYLKACQLYNNLPSEFQARNVKLHYDILKLYFAIKETHDLHEDAKQSNFVMTFTNRFNEALGSVKSDVSVARRIHDDLHTSVLALPNEEIKLKSELLEQLVFLRNQISVVESQQLVTTHSMTTPPSPSSPVPKTTVPEELAIVVPKKLVDLDSTAEPQPIQNKSAPVPKNEAQTQMASAETSDVVSSEERRAKEVRTVTKTFTQPVPASVPQIPKVAFAKKETPLVEKKNVPVPVVEKVEKVSSDSQQGDSKGKMTTPSHEEDVIGKLRSIPAEQESVEHKVASDEHLEALRARANKIKSRLHSLHGKLES